MSDDDSTEQVVKDLEEMKRKYRETHTLEFEYVEFFELYEHGELIGRYDSKEQIEEKLNQKFGQYANSDWSEDCINKCLNESDYDIVRKERIVMKKMRWPKCEPGKVVTM